jgi:hypothetical protein
MNITCGEYGLCDGGGGGGCSPNYQVVDSDVNAVFPVNYSTTCQEKAAYANLYHDVNGCPGSEDYTACSYWTIHTHALYNCCLDVTCADYGGPCSPYFAAPEKGRGAASAGGVAGDSWPRAFDSQPPPEWLACATPLAAIPFGSPARLCEINNRAKP